MTRFWICNGPVIDFSLFLLGFILLHVLFICIALGLLISIRYHSAAIPKSIHFANFLYPVSYHGVIILLLLLVLKECVIWIREVAIYLYRLRIMYYDHDQYLGSRHQMYVAYELSEYLEGCSMQIECELCNQIFTKDTHQILLKCGHRFCNVCLTEYEGLDLGHSTRDIHKCPICEACYNNQHHKWDYQYDRNKNVFTTMACQKLLFVRVIRLNYVYH
eukprot:531549_1